MSEMECETCHESMILTPGMEWPESGPVYCWECAHKEITRLRLDVQRLTKQRDHYMRVASDLVAEEVAHQNGLSIEVSDE